MKKMFNGRRANYSADAGTLRTCMEFAEVATACFNRPCEAETFMEYLRDGCTFTAMGGVLTGSNKEKIIGFAVFQKNDRYIELISFGVHPDFQNHGLGRQMLQSFVKKADAEQLNILTSISEGDVAARKILSSLGFEILRSKREMRAGIPVECHYLHYRCQSPANVFISMDGYVSIAK